MTVSHGRIEGYMPAMVMAFRVRDSRQLAGLMPGARVEFTLMVGRNSSWADKVATKGAAGGVADPLQVGAAEASANAIEIGRPVPDFSLIDQAGRTISLAQFQGKVVAVTFIYTRCPLPDYCIRLSNNFAHMQKLFRDRMGKDLVLLSITLDPQYDTPEVLTGYAKIWKAEAAGWHFLTGPLEEIREICSRFGVDFWPDGDTLTHPLETAVMDREGKLAARVAGNQFTVQQLGDLVETILDRP